MNSWNGRRISKIASTSVCMIPERLRDCMGDISLSFFFSFFYLVRVLVKQTSANNSPELVKLGNTNCFYDFLVSVKTALLIVI